MHVQCPKCASELDLTVEVVTAAEGLIRCGDCDTTFNALALIPEREDAADSKPKKARASAQTGAKASDSGAEPKPRPELESQPGGAGGSGDEGDDDSQSSRSARDELPMDDLFEDAPESLLPGDGPPLQIGAEAEIQRSGHWWVVASLVLVVVLGFQLVVASTGALSRFPATRPVAEAICTVINCSVPQARQLDAISLLNRDIRKHPSVDGGLMITATMTNMLDSQQPFPVVEIQLSDLDGRAIALRRFNPEEYLAADTDIAAGMPPEVLVPMSFEVVDPGDTAVAFEFRFR